MFNHQSKIRDYKVNHHCNLGIISQNVGVAVISPRILEISVFNHKVLLIIRSIDLVLQIYNQQGATIPKDLIQNISEQILSFLTHLLRI